MTTEHQHHLSNTHYQGTKLAAAERAIIAVHGRGASAADILTLMPHLAVSDFAQIAPQATARTWYPYSFMAPIRQNEPGLSSALKLLNELVDQCLAANIPGNQIYLIGFSQGACLTLEFAARHARRYGGVFALSGGLIGDELDVSRYSNNFEQTPIFLGCSDVDPHIPLHRVEESAAILQSLGATVTKEIYPNMPHTIIQQELDQVNAVLK